MVMTLPAGGLNYFGGVSQGTSTAWTFFGILEFIIQHQSISAYRHSLGCMEKGEKLPTWSKSSETPAQVSHDHSCCKPWNLIIQRRQKIQSFTISSNFILHSFITRISTNWACPLCWNQLSYPILGHNLATILQLLREDYFPISVIHWCNFLA